MIKQQYNEVVTDEMLVGTLDHNVHTGFLEDYRTISCLLRKFKPESILEIGTNVGSGINVMKVAVPQMKIYSLDLDYATMMQNSKQYPIGPNGEDRVGSAVKWPYVQLRGDSMTFDYSKYPCEAAFIDGEHDYDHPHHEAKEMIKTGTKLIMFHDADIPEVYNGIVDAFKGNEDYDLYRVEGTRIAYAVKK